VSTRAARSRLARSIRAHVNRKLSSDVREVHYADVRSTNPLQVELQGRRLVLDEDHLVVTQWVRQYDYQHGLQVGDTVVVSHMSNDDFLVHDVVSTNKMEAGADEGTRATVSLTSRNGHIVGTVPYLGDDGTVIGYLPLYSSLTSDGPPA
jgi:hypothetical protein